MPEFVCDASGQHDEPPSHYSRMNYAVKDAPPLPHREVECKVQSFVEEWPGRLGSGDVASWLLDVRNPTQVVGVIAGSWLDTVLMELRDLTGLKKDWDAYGAPAIESTVVVHALKFLDQIAVRGNSTPAIVATGRGNVQLEWHYDGAEIDVEISPDGTFEASFESPEAAPAEWSGNVWKGIPPELSRRVLLLTKRWVV